MKNVYVIAGGISKFAKARPDKTFPAIVKESYALLLEDLGIEPKQAFELIDGTVASYFSDHFFTPDTVGQPAGKRANHK